MALTKPQRRLLRYIAKWGDAASSYAEECVGCQGAAFDAVLNALYRRDLIRLDDNDVIRLTSAGDGALEEGRR